ncbi:MAG: YfhO family protein [Bacteroidaceae bacterium]|nr:YfhO family protein [Bacteroidaceae bacterium]
MGWLRSVVPDLLAILFFVLLSFAYFIKPVSEGMVLTGHDHSGGVGAGAEMEAYREAHDGERTRWTNTLFSGMPTYQIAPSYDSTDTLAKVEKAYYLWLPDYVRMIFIMLLGFYILLRAFDFKVWMAALGAVVWAFSSYYFIIIAAGHIWKFYTLAFIPPTIAGMVMCYRGRYIWGFVVTALFMGLQILSNHVQMSYYFIIVLVAMAIAMAPFSLLRGKRQLPEAASTSINPANGTSSWGEWLKGSLVFAAGCIVGVLMNISNLYHTYEYSKESMRSKSELTQKSKDPADQTSGGLERSYITAWSYGIGETWTLLVPNAKGGASQPLTQNKTAMAKANQMYMPIYQSLGQYWGEQPGTSGPVYVGAFVIMLFILGLIIVKGPIKWALLTVTILSIMLSWGKNFMGLTDFFLDYVPMYDKFRTVASILVVAEFSIPLLAMFALKELVRIASSDASEGDGSRAKADAQTAGSKTGPAAASKAVLISAALTGGICLLFWIMPDVFFGNYISSSEMSMLSDATSRGYIPQDMLAPIIQSVSEMRRAMFTSDAMRSFWIILVGTLVLMAYIYRKIKLLPMVVCLIVLCVADMWDINKRYLSDEMFSKPQPKQEYFAQTEADKMILQDPDLYYRVLDLSANTFNDNTASYWHKSIGGYHPAKLRRYQELIEAHIHPEIMEYQQAVVSTGGRTDSIDGYEKWPVLNMLNMKYAIFPLQDGQKMPLMNKHAMGNAWFVRDIKAVDNADDELAELKSVDLRTTAVMRQEDAEALKSVLSVDSAARLQLTAYEANSLTFESKAAKDGVAVFSDIYYPGWTCIIDGGETDIHRANYVLRAVAIPAGQHKIEFRFDPASLHMTEAVAYGALALLLLLVVGGIWKSRRPRA